MSFSSCCSPGASSAGSPRNLLTTKPAISAWSAGSSTATVPNRWASSPPRSMSPTSTTGRSAARASPMLAKSVARRLISAGDPAPSQITTSNSARSDSSSAVTTARLVAVFDVVDRAHGAGHVAANHQLRGAVAARLEQDRVEPDAGFQPARPRLHRLGSADLAAVDGDHRVVGHVLRLERRHPNSLAGQQPAQPGDDHRLAGVGSGAGDQQRAAHGCAERAPTAKIRPQNRGGCTFARPLTVGSRSPRRRR